MWKTKNQKKNKKIAKMREGERERERINGEESKIDGRNSGTNYGED